MTCEPACCTLTTPNPVVYLSTPKTVLPPDHYSYQCMSDATPVSSAGIGNEARVSIPLVNYPPFRTIHGRTCGGRYSE